MITDSLYAEGLAYDWRTSSSGGSSSYSISDLSSGYNNNGRPTSNTSFPGATYNLVSGQWEGPSVKQQVNTESAQTEVNNSSTNISKRFNKR